MQIILCRSDASRTSQSFACCPLTHRMRTRRRPPPQEAAPQPWFQAVGSLDPAHAATYDGSPTAIGLSCISAPTVSVQPRYPAEAPIHRAASDSLPSGLPSASLRGSRGHANSLTSSLPQSSCMLTTMTRAHIGLQSSMGFTGVAWLDRRDELGECGS
ncbi:hypothetical protein CC80DRAFT_274124 [Byssothecium circinans]|uniref:Uncharacterized protein n=1 Tax=Byssothecium circinans TaxID=147558 RepID=A0A6A5TF40_9PLEO|nr:hypothetical protein CC80DRAFT_274124 [Byssothecium circinans]